MGAVVGIDLGTTFSAVAVFEHEKKEPQIVLNKEGERTTPSVIQFMKNHQTGEITTIVGKEAKEAFEIGDDGCVSAFKRLMGTGKEYFRFEGKSYDSVELSAILLRYLKEGAEYTLGKQIDEAVITVPAYFEDKERRATMEAAKRAGLKVRMIINEPSAAALAFGLKYFRENARILVYDLGGGTFDVTLVQMRNNGQLHSIKTVGDHLLGGKDWDSRICAMVKAEIEEDTGYEVDSDRDFVKQILGLTEILKKKLTNSEEAAVNVQVPGYGKYTIKVDRKTFEEETVDLLARTGSLCKHVLKEAGMEWNDITDILLVGGSTKMKQVPAYLEELSGGKKPLSQLNPDEAVALGAAIQSTMTIPDYVVYSEEEERNQAKTLVLMEEVSKTTQRLTSLSMLDIQAHAMGIILENEEGTAYINANIIPENQVVPVKRALACKFFTSEKKANEMEIYVLQGRKAPADSMVSHKFVAEGIRHVSGGETLLRVQYSYDQNGLIHVQVRQEEDCFDLPVREETIPEDMSVFSKTIEKKEIYAYLIIDTSGSMWGNPIESAKEAMRGFVREVGQTKTKIGIMLVANSTYVQLEPTSDYKKCMEAIDSINERQCGSGNAAQPFDKLRNEFANVEGEKRAVILADGCWNNQAIAISAAKKCHSEGINIAAVGFGGADRRFLEEISSVSADAIMTTQGNLGNAFSTIARSIGSGSKQRSKGIQTETQTWEAPDER